ncbi:MAG: aminopeptidase P family protein [Bacteroidales bacterium]|nr:aminopeptidase P family protein [Bacteroidales bacterium]
MNPITERLKELRAMMEQLDIQAFIVPSTDPHSGEYVPEHWKARRWITGFTGSAGTAVITLHSAALWTDSRYFLQAAEQLQGTGIQLMKECVEGTPTIPEWLATQLKQDDTVAIDGWVNTVTETEELEKELKSYGFNLVTDFDPFATLWTDRPAVPEAKAQIHSLEYAGESAANKLARIRQQLDGKALLVSMLEEIAWTLNLRGKDVEYTPFLVSYLIITPDNATLYINPEKMTPEVEEYLKGEGVDWRPYTEVIEGIKEIETPMVAQPGKTNYAAFSAIRNPLKEDSPIGRLLIFKNPTEIKAMRRAMEKDGVAMVKWIKWALEEIPKGGHTELSLSRRLEEFRAEQPLNMGPSFESIMGYAHHGAIVHYDPTPETDIPVKPEGLLLIDSGGQYLDGTTDITRTIPLGPLTWEMKRDYTLVLKGWINLGRAVFPKGTCGTQLDGLARMDMWRYGINYLHGTGHGVGQYMSVHEGIDLHQFRMQWRPTPLLPGMIITDEPGIYIAGSHGVRHEDTMLVVNASFSGENGRAIEPAGEPQEGDEAQGLTFGPYYTFERLTLCPVLTSPIIREMLSYDEAAWFNKYQADVLRRLSPYLDAEHQEWLNEVTRPI